MTWLLDVSALVAHVVESHEHHARVDAWWPGKQLAVCPITELGFIRVTCALGFAMSDARDALAAFIQNERPDFVSCHLHALDCPPVQSARKTTDIYLAELAASRGWQLATLDAGIPHPAAVVIPELPGTVGP